jgi:aryl-alcohol dehydrogenase-like predicted oxidoreductase
VRCRWQGGGRDAATPQLFSLVAEFSDKILVLATKFGILLDPATGSPAGVDGSPDYVRAAIHRSLTRLGVDHPDMSWVERDAAPLPASS